MCIICSGVIVPVRLIAVTVRVISTRVVSQRAVIRVVIRVAVVLVPIVIRVVRVVVAVCRIGRAPRVISSEEVRDQTIAVRWDMNTGRSEA